MEKTLNTWFVLIIYSVSYNPHSCPNDKKSIDLQKLREIRIDY